MTHSPKHWSTEEAMVEYIKQVIVLYVEHTCEGVGDATALVIMDSFKGQTP